MNDFDERLARLSPERRALLKLLLEEEAARAPASSIRSRPRELADAPLSRNQEWQWRLEQMRPGGVGNNKLQTRVKGKLDLHALEQALSEIVRRQQALRTSFVLIGDEPVQRVQPPRRVPLPLTDLSGMSEREQRIELERLAVRVLETIFDLTSGMLVQARLVRLDSEDHVLLIALSHLVSDGWSNTLFMREAMALYDAFSGGRPSPLPELKVQYADYAVWQREWLRSDEGKRAVARLKQRLEGAAPIDFKPLKGLAANARPADMVETFLVLSPDRSAALKELNGREQVTLFMTTLALFLIVLYQHTGREDLVVGSTIANRQHVEIENVIGFFANPLTLRVSLSGNPSLRETLRRVQQETLENYALQDIPFLTLTETLEPGFDLQSTFSLHRVLVEMDTVEVTESTSAAALDAVAEEARRNARPPALRFEPARLEYEEKTSGYDLILRSREEARGIVFRLLYDPERFEASFVEAVLGQMRTLLEMMTKSPEMSLRDLPSFT